jgi:hypothetical protein
MTGPQDAPQNKTPANPGPQGRNNLAQRFERWVPAQEIPTSPGGTT